MPALRTSITGVVDAVSTERRSFKVTVRQPAALGQVWFQMSPRRPNTPLPVAGQQVSFDAYGPQQDIVYEVKSENVAPTPGTTDDTVASQPVTGLRSSRATVEQPEPPKPGNTEPNHWTRLTLTDGLREIEGMFRPIGSPVWGVMDRKTGAVYPLHIVYSLTGAVK